MRKMLCVLGLAVLSACSSPSIRLQGVEARRVVVEGWDIDVYAEEGYAEAIRVSTDWQATPALMRERGLVAVEQATGWRVDRRTITGDGSIVRMKSIARRT